MSDQTLDVDGQLAARIDRIVEWNGHLHNSERSGLHDAAQRLRMHADRDS